MSTDYDRDTLFTELPVANSTMRIRYRKTDSGSWAAVDRYNGTTGKRTIYDPYICDSANTLIAYTSTDIFYVAVPSLRFDLGVAAPTLKQEARISNTATADLTVASQAPYASASGSNRNPGNLVLSVPAAASGGTQGKISLQVAGAAVVEADPAKIFVATTTGAPSTDPTGGVYLYLEGDVLKYRTSAGVVKNVTVT